MAAPPSLDPTLRLRIGPLAFTIEGLGGDAELLAAAYVRYGAFVVAEHEGPPLELAVTLYGLEPPPVEDVPARVTRSGARRYQLEVGSLRGEVDLASGRGTATIASSVYVIDTLLRLVTTVAGLERGVLLLHSSGGWIGEGQERRILVCFGPSGVGKTTVARTLPPDDLLCDEMMLLEARPDGSVWAHGTPFHGEHPETRAGSGLVAALVRLVQSPSTQLRPLSVGQAARQLLGSTLFFSDDHEHAEALLSLALRIGPGLTYTLEFTRDTHVPRLLHDQLTAPR
jgi:hypothetical protein